MSIFIKQQIVTKTLTSIQDGEKVKSVGEKSDNLTLSKQPGEKPRSVLWKTNEAPRQRKGRL